MSDVLRQGWSLKPINSLGKVITGKTPPKAETRYYVPEQFLFVSPKDLDYDKFYVHETETRISEAALKKFRNQVLPPFAVMFTSLSYSFGKIGITKEHCLTNQQINSIVTNKNNDFKFVYYLLRASEPFIFQYNSGIDTPIVPKSVFERIQLLVPELPIQQRIASILSTYDDLIEVNNQRIKILEETASQLYKEWFVRMRFPGYKQTKFEKGIPEGWIVQPLLSLCSRITDGTHDTPKPVEEGFPLITGTHISNGQIDFSSAYKISSSDHEKIKKRSGLEKGDILFSNIGTIGSTAIVTEDFDYSVKNIIIFKPLKDYSLFLNYMISAGVIREQMLLDASGTSQQFISLGYIRKLKVLVPKRYLVEKYSKIVSPIIQQVTLLRKQNIYLRQIRDRLLPRLISGILQVKEQQIKTIKQPA